MSQTYSNNASSTLASNYTAADTTITVQTGDGAKFPSTGDFMVAMGNPVSFYLKCTARSTDTLTVSTTGQEGTTAVNQSSGAVISHVITAAALTAIITQQAGMVLLEQHTASNSASLNFTACISSTYDTYQIQLVKVVPASSSVQLYMRCSSNGGSSYDTGSNYKFSYYSANDAAGSGAHGVSGVNAIQIAAAVDNTAGNSGYSGTLTLCGPGSTNWKTVHGTGCWIVTNILISSMVSGAYIAASAIDAFQFLFHSGNIASGTIRIYGLTK